MIVQQISEGVFVQCRQFCRVMEEIFTANADATVFISDETHFHLDGYVNIHGYKLNREDKVVSFPSQNQNF